LKKLAPGIIFKHRQQDVIKIFSSVLELLEIFQIVIAVADAMIKIGGRRLQAEDFHEVVAGVSGLADVAELRKQSSPQSFHVLQNVAHLRVERRRKRETRVGPRGKTARQQNAVRLVANANGRHGSAAGNIFGKQFPKTFRRVLAQDFIEHAVKKITQ